MLKLSERYGTFNLLANILALAMCLFQLYTAFFGTFEAFYQRSIHVALAVTLVFLISPLKNRKFQFFDALYILITLVTMGYLIVNHDALIYERFCYIDPVSSIQIILGFLAIGVILEATRRVVGPQLPLVAMVFLVYAYLGPYLPGFLHHKGFSTGLLIDVEYLTTSGIFSSPIAISSTYLFLFIILGAVLVKTGFGDFLRDFAVAIAGRARGGPAKVAVIGSALMGSVSGSAVANVVTTGSVTIPLMQKIGLKPRFAAAVEAVASSGGQIMPPIMGAAAFLMAEFTGIPYITIMGYGVIPGLLYFAAVFFMVDIEAARNGLSGLKKQEIPDLRQTMRKSYLALPMILLVIILIKGYTPSLAGLIAIVTSLILGLIEKENRKDLIDYFSCLIVGCKDALPVILSCASAGIIVGVVGLTGIGASISSVVISVAGNSMFFALVLTMIAGIILGMGLPTAPMYVIMVALIVPSLIELGVPVHAAHMFVVYFAAITMITPPVALASFAAAGVARTNAMAVGWEGMRIGAVAYIIPFMFVYSPALLLQGTVSEIVIATITALVGTYALAIGLQGHFITKTSLIQRAMALAAAINLIFSGTYTDLVGILLLIALYLLQRFSNKSKLSPTVTKNN